MPDFQIPPEVAGRTIATMLRDQAARMPNRAALIGASPRLGETTLTYAQLSWRARRFADALLRSGVRPGDRVGVMLGSDAAIEFAVSMMAVHELGGVFVPVNTRFALEEVVYIANKAALKALVAGEAYAAMLRTARGRMPALASLIVLHVQANDSADDWYNQYERAAVQRDRVPPSAPQDLAEILFTSGTTAHPKGAMMTHQSALASCYSVVGGEGIVEGDVWQSFMPVFTTGGVRCAAMGCWFAGATIVFDPVLKIADVIDRMERVRTTKYVGTPAFYVFLLDEMKRRPVDLSNLQTFLFGGAPTTAEVIKRLHAEFPRVELRNGYAPTETGPGGSELSGEDVLANPTSVGRPWPLVEIKIVGDDDATLPAGERGEVCTRGPCVMQGYYGEPEKSAEALKGGWHHTGDIGVLDEQGLLYIVDRKKDMIIRGGHNIASLEVESVLAQHPAVAEAAVVGVAHEKLGEDIHAFVMVRAGRTVTPEELRAFCADKLADYKTPRKISVIDQLPRSSMGKVMKSELRERAAGIAEPAALAPTPRSSS
jgi:acyl-CoA synthetase (AMP-forming)/AMP-acid ligase II